MCDFCHKHGEGKKWYLEAKNYSEDLLSDLRRRKFIAEFVSDSGKLTDSAKKLEDLERLPSVIRKVLTWRISRQMKDLHFGQVLPIEDIERIFGFVTSITRLSCICRKSTIGSEKRYCYGISVAPEGKSKMADLVRQIDPAFMAGPEKKGLERVTKEEALAQFREYEKEGMCHTVWTFVTPFIMGLCNCDRADCLAMRSSVTHKVPVMFRAEYVAGSDPDSCSGCRECMRVCQFGAITFSAGQGKVSIDRLRCYGCGICRSVCAADAIALKDRRSDPVAARLWES
jgi:Pyruvate/2-oxoacid:ferredoxin oxidoreductase delta subunit